MKVLNAGHVILQEVMGTDRTIDQCARVSFGFEEKERTDEQIARLVNYLWRNKHTSPFEMVETRWLVKAPIFVARQWMRHRTASINEMSGRYVKLYDEFYEPTEWRLKPTDGAKQGSSSDSLAWDDHIIAVHIMDQAIRAVREAHQQLDALGVANELSRMIMPVSQYTEWVWKIDLHNLLHFLTLRLDDHAQKEIRDYAEAMVAQLVDVLPMTMKVWGDD